VAAGTYSTGTSTNRSGTSGARIAYISDSQYGAKLTGAASGAMWTNTGAFMDVVGFDFDGSATGTAIGYYQTIPAANHNLFLSKKVHDICPASACADGPGDVIGDFWIGTNPTVPLANVFQRNLIYHNAGGYNQHSFPTPGNGSHALDLAWGDIAQD